MKIDLRSLLFAVAATVLASCGANRVTAPGEPAQAVILPLASASSVAPIEQLQRSTDATTASIGSNGIPWRALTAAYLEQPASFYPASMSWSYAHIALDYAWTTDALAGLQRAAGMHVISYVDAQLALDSPNATPPERSLPSSAIARDCDGTTPMTTSYNGSVTQYLTRPDSSGLTTGINAFIKSWEYVYDGVETDDGVLYSQMGLTFYSGGNGHSGTVRNYPYCGYADSAYATALRSFYAALAAPVIVNTLGGGLPTPGESWMSLVWQNGSLSRNVIGVMCEACFANQTVGPGSFNYKLQSAYSDLWGYHVQSIMSLIADHRKVVVENDLCSSEIDRRLYSLASLLLAYDPTYVIEMFGQNCNPPSKINVMPETKLVPTQPLVSTTNLFNLEASTGAYVREYAKCYLGGTALGGCAVVVNPNADASVSMPSFHQSYTGTVAFSGTGIYGSFGDTGKIWTVPNSVPKAIGPTESVILVQ